jgi:hypothetical protein
MSQEQRKEELGNPESSLLSQNAISAFLNIKDGDPNFQRNLTTKDQVISYQVDGINPDAPIVIYVFPQWHTSFYEADFDQIHDSIGITTDEEPVSQGTYYNGWFYLGTDKIAQRKFRITNGAKSLLLKIVDITHVPVVFMSLHSTLLSTEFVLTRQRRHEETLQRTRPSFISTPVPIPPLTLIPRALSLHQALRDVDINVLTERFNNTQKLRLGYVLHLRTALSYLNSCHSKDQLEITIDQIRSVWISSSTLDGLLSDEERLPTTMFVTSNVKTEVFQSLGKCMLNAHTNMELKQIRSNRSHHCSLSPSCIFNKIHSLCSEPYNGTPIAVNVIHECITNAVEYIFEMYVEHQSHMIDAQLTPASEINF